ncbi:hypothetical protein [uncultured Lacinutrix sp.]|uniref:hypothetical protein n=1 Tax=uncultured Lacinutrix sp. TaxID=574032 RepID=UPI002608F5D9|nr:hypothetical protein [uncultured Lacinutrix sp.]
MGIGKKLKVRIIFGVVSGLFFAITMWLLDSYYDDETFNINKFLFHFIFFGIFQGIISGFYIKKDKPE